jgi:dTDP-4-amino-4,6-dideoxygalactose transaminase
MRRKELWDIYAKKLVEWAHSNKVMLPALPTYATNNAHMFYLIVPSLAARTILIENLKKQEISAVFHYLSLHSSQFYVDKHDGRALPNSDHLSDTLVRLPMYFDLSIMDIERVCKIICNAKFE